MPGLNVLVVDNNAVNREIFAEMLKNWRMNPTLADSGASGPGTVGSRAKMPAAHFRSSCWMRACRESTDFRSCSEFKRIPGLAGAVIMMLSANRHLADTAACRELGVKHCLTKPVGQSELLDAILIGVGTGRRRGTLDRVTGSQFRKNRRGRPLNILLSEDNPVNQKLAIRLLEKAGHRVTLAGTGREALAAWENAGIPGFDVVLMDIQMPEMDGMEATAAIRQREKKSGKHIPILAMTAHAMRGDKERYLASGMDGYISKPIHPAGLFAEIERCLAAVGREQRHDGKFAGTGRANRPRVACWSAWREIRNCSPK